MEHLPAPRGQTTSIFPTIPYLFEEDRYDGGPFLEYPQRLELPNIVVKGNFRLAARVSNANRRLLAAAPSVAIEAFLQIWLFFGLLSEVLGNLYCHEDFVTTLLDGGTKKTIVTTAQLITRLQEWEAKIVQETISLMSVYEHVAKCLNLAHACLAIPYPNFDNDLKFHLASVAELVGYAANKACNIAWTDDPRRSLTPINWGSTIDEKYRESVLLERSNCCPSQMQMLSQVFKEPQALAFVANCFYDDGVQSDHASCDDDHCQAGSLVNSDQITRHVQDSCGCEILKIDETLLADCLKRGCLPLLRLKKDADLDQISIDVVPSTDSTSYVALSHVWADGLGNPIATALPHCQLLRLKTLIDNLDIGDIDGSHSSRDVPEILLWCDTLCCPVVSKEAKSMALRQMYRTYDEASMVLVLDRSLISHRFGGMSVDEACVRIATSRWMTRLWTLQEGALPAKKNTLWFQFTKTALPVSALYNHLVKIQKTDIRRRGVVTSVIGRFYTFTTLFDLQGSKNGSAQMKDVMSGLMYRAVTVPSDEPLIIATLLNLDLDKILNSDPEERMNTLWRMIGTSPSGIDKQFLFHMGPKLHERGLRWAPQSLLSMDRYFAIPKSGEEESRGFLGEEPNAIGLGVKLAGFRISIAKPAGGLPGYLAGYDSQSIDDINKNVLLMKDSMGRWYILRHRLYGTSDCPPELEAMSAVVSRMTSPWILYRGSSSLIPDEKKGHLALLVGETNAQQLQSSGSACVEIKSQVGFCHVTTELNLVIQAAFHLTQELASSAAARHLNYLQGSSPKDQNDPVYQEAYQSVRLEMQRLSRSPHAMEAVAASGNSDDEPTIIGISEYIERIYRGLYVQIEEYAPNHTKWYVE